MEAAYLTALDPYLIPPLARIVLDYLVLTYTLDLTDGQDDFPCYRIYTTVTPFRNHIACTYSNIESEISKAAPLIFKGWALTHFPDYYVDGGAWLVTKKIETNLEGFSSCLDKLAQESPNDVEMSLFGNLMVNDGFCCKGDSNRIFDMSHNFTGVTKGFVEIARLYPTNYNSEELWGPVKEYLTR